MNVPVSMVSLGMLLLLLTVTGWGAELLPTPIAGEFGAPRLLVPPPDDANYAHLSWPKIVRAADGTLVLGYIAGKFHGTHGGGSPAVSISTDGGKTFTPPTILQTFNRTTLYTSAGNLALGVAEDGAVVLLAMAYTGSERSTVVGWRSTDSGRSWTPCDTSTLQDNKTGSVFGNIFPVPGKGLAVTGHYRAGSTPYTQGVWIAYSNDGGKRWGAPIRITERAMVEPSLLYTQGRYIGLLRPAEPNSTFVQIVSEDGAQWTLLDAPIPPQLPEGQGMIASPCILADGMQPGRLFALQTERTRGQTWTPGMITLWTADAHTLAWSPLGTLAQFPSTLGAYSDFGYPWMAQIDAHTWFLVFYCGKHNGPNGIFGMPVTILAR